MDEDTYILNYSIYQKKSQRQAKILYVRIQDTGYFHVWLTYWERL